MVSDKYLFSDNSEQVANIPLSIEEFGKFAGLTPDNARVLSLLSEETIGMILAVLPKFQGMVWAENSENKFYVVASIDAVIKSKERDDLLKASGGKNDALKSGLLGKIGSLIINWSIANNDNPLPPMMYPEMEMGMGMVNGYEEWSMRSYLDSMSEQSDKEKPVDDGLERSIIEKLADDCKMSVKSGSVKMVVIKTFK
jgi:hypothetical protein